MTRWEQTGAAGSICAAVVLKNSIPDIPNKSNPVIKTGRLAGISDAGEVKIEGLW